MFISFCANINWITKIILKTNKSDNLGLLPKTIQRPSLLSEESAILSQTTEDYKEWPPNLSDLISSPSFIFSHWQDKMAFSLIRHISRCES